MILIFSVFIINFKINLIDSLNIFNLFILDKNPSHIYAVRMFIDGKWTTIMLDTCFPANQYGDLCAAQSYNNQIWVMLLEKAWAKVFGSYDNINAGYN